MVRGHRRCGLPHRRAVLSGAGLCGQRRPHRRAVPEAVRRADGYPVGQAGRSLRLDVPRINKLTSMCVRVPPGPEGSGGTRRSGTERGVEKRSGKLYNVSIRREDAEAKQPRTECADGQKMAMSALRRLFSAAMG